MIPESRYAILIVAALAACTAGDDTIELSLAHATPPQSLVALSADEFARRANQQLGERARVVVYGAGQLGGDELVLQKIKLGTVDMAVNSTVMASAVEAFALFELPYLVQDREHMQRIENEIFWPHLAPLALQHGYQVLALWENGFRHVTNNTRPIESPDDLRGIKIRTPRSSWRMRVFRTFGARPSPLPFSEVFMALQTGVMDGQENPLSNVVQASLHEVQRYLSLTGHVYSPAYLVVSERRWVALPEDVRSVLHETARTTREFVFTQAAELDERMLRELQQTGIEINRPDPERFREASRPVYDDFVAAVPAASEWIANARLLMSTAARDSL